MIYTNTLNLADIGAEYLRTSYLTGLTMCGSDGQSLPDVFFEDKIRMAMEKVETLTTVDFVERVNLAEKHDYYIDEYTQFGFMNLHRIPAIDVLEVRAVYPTSTTMVTFPQEWIRLDRDRSQLHLVPTAGTLSQVLIGQGGNYLPLVYQGISRLPQLWEVDYRSGFPTDKLPRMFVDAVMKLAAIDVLSIMSDLIGPLGVSSGSLSVDGLSQSMSRQLPAFKARIDLYNAELGVTSNPPYSSGLIAQLRSTYCGVPLVGA